MEAERDLRDPDAILDVDLDDLDPTDIDAAWLPPPATPEPPGPIPPAAPEADMRGLTWVLLGIVAGLGALKLALFAVGGALATGLLGAVFVAAHGLLLAAGGTWFWGERYR
jgi:hypothetical protein